ncbi:adenylate kinase 1, chloroplastic-like [Raphanus sativus]|uniref:adenylate kinase n=1 Tax=Raphanus sativus TaxID=3726 RepID=A0A9W3D464_RAPSA|nr:adenylate kinase 1, chloroplastic-like [Raphanus sativus]
MLREHVSCRAHALKKKSEVSSSLPLFLSTGSVSPMIGPPFGSLFQVETEKRHLASRLLTLLGVPHIATGDLVHEELASLGPFSRQLSEIVNQGKLVSDEIIVNLLSKRLEAGEAKGESGFILYGFPRTMRQAEMLGDVTDISLVVNLKLPEEVLVDKCLGRRMQQRFQRRAH